MATGVRIATTGVLLIKVDSSRAVIIRLNRVRHWLPPPMRASQLPRVSTQPVRSSAADRINMQAMVMGALFDNTPMTSAGLSNWLTSSTATAMPTTTSGLNLSRANA